MMPFVRHEIREHMADIEWQIAPHVRFGRRNMASRSQSEFEERLYAGATALESRQQFPACSLSRIDERRCTNAMLLPERPDPACSSIVEMRSNHANRALRCPRDRHVPQRRRKMLDE